MAGRPQAACHDRQSASLLLKSALQALMRELVTAEQVIVSGDLSRRETHWKHHALENTHQGLRQDESQTKKNSKNKCKTVNLQLVHGKYIFFLLSKEFDSFSQSTPIMWTESEPGLDRNQNQEAESKPMRCTTLSPSQHSPATAVTVTLLHAWQWLQQYIY